MKPLFKWLAVPAVVIVVLLCMAAIPDFTAFNQTQFSTNGYQVSISSGVPTTNENLYGNPTVIKTIGSYNGQPTVFNGMPDLVANVILQNINGNVGETTFYTSPASPATQMYRVSVYQNCPTQGSGGTLHTFFTYFDNVTKRTNSPAADITLTSTNNSSQGTAFIVVSNSTVINYGETASGLSGGALGNAYWVVERIQ